MQENTILSFETGPTGKKAALERSLIDEPGCCSIDKRLQRLRNLGSDQDRHAILHGLASFYVSWWTVFFIYFLEDMHKEIDHDVVDRGKFHCHETGFEGRAG